MKPRLIWRIARKSFSSNWILQVPFIMATAIMAMLFFLLLSLQANHFMLTRHPDLPALFRVSIFILGFFTVIFLFYANRFLMKRRQLEFGLYSVLGLGKASLSLVLLVEQFLQWFLSMILGLTGGISMGKLVFLALNRLVGTLDASLKDFYFEPPAALTTILFFAGLMGLLWLWNSLGIRLGSPMSLMKKSVKGQGVPRGALPLAILGSFLLLGGYYLAWRKADYISQLIVYFFIAILLVMLATYLLFYALTTFILKRMAKSTAYYEKPERFLAVSGMLYRLKTNAVGLANIAILSTGLIIAITTTSTFVQSSGNMILQNHPREYSVRGSSQVQNLLLAGKPGQARQTMEAKIRSLQPQGVIISDLITKTSLNTQASLAGNQILPEGQGKSIGLRIMDPQTYEIETGVKPEIQPGQVLISSNIEEQLEEIRIASRSFKVVPDHRLKIIQPDPQIFLVVPNDKTFALVTQIITPAMSFFSEVTSYWDAEVDNEDSYLEIFTNESSGINATARKKEVNRMGETNGGFLFIGVILSLIALIGTNLIMFYKQISEGYEDEKQIAIMRKVGLSEEMIRKTGDSQIRWMFFLPLGVAAIHSYAASFMIHRLNESLMGSTYPVVLRNITITLVIFGLAYYSLYRLSSRAYHYIIKEEPVDPNILA